MPKTKIVSALQTDLADRVDELAVECAKVDPKEEKALAEEGSREASKRGLRTKTSIRWPI